MQKNHSPNSNIPLPSPHLAHPKYRPDIDGLRAIAVLCVVFFHAFPQKVKGGFIGVDIFFVISGFLISTIIFKSLDRNEFSFYEFYSRRIRRIFPSLLTILITCFALGWGLMYSDEYKHLGKHIASGASFISNFVLWNESGYFDAAAETKPLLHLWSLGIEEQFYIAWPLILWISWRSNFNLFFITVSIFSISFSLNLAKSQSDGVAAFYSPQTRFWELLAGSFLAYATLYNNQSLRHFKQWHINIISKVPLINFSKNKIKTTQDFKSVTGAIFIITGLLFITKEKNFPGAWALLPVLGTVLVIAAGKDAWLNRVVLSNRVLVWIGLISFPLYLWHWPLLSFPRIIESETPHLNFRIFVIFLSIALAWITYKIIEHPLRFGKRNNLKVFSLLTIMALIGYAGFNTFQNNGLPFGKEVRDWEKSHALIKWEKADNSDNICKKYFTHQYNYCKSTENKPPTVVLIGDSIANSYFYGLSDEYKKNRDNLFMLGSGGCPPLIDIKSGFSGEADWCNSQSSNAIKEVAKQQNVHTVILAANWHLYINGTRFYERYDKPWRIEANGEKEKINAVVFSEQLIKTIKFLEKNRKKIIIIKQSPEINLNPISCLESRPLHPGNKIKDCTVDSYSVRSYLAEYETIFESAIQNNTRIHVLDPYPILCPDTRCMVMDGINPIYRDSIHLSAYGSRYLASRLNLF